MAHLPLLQQMVVEHEACAYASRLRRLVSNLTTGSTNVVPRARADGSGALLRMRGQAARKDRHGAEHGGSSHPPDVWGMTRRRQRPFR